MANRILVSVDENTASPDWLNLIEGFVYNVLKELEYDDEEISIMFCDDKCIQELNSTYRKIDSATDVLSFENGLEYTDEDGNKWFAAGDIAISLDMLKQNAQYFEVSENEELKRLLIHGILHLNGYDHGEEHVEKGVEPKCEMLQIQKRLMEKFSDIIIIAGK